MLVLPDYNKPYIIESLTAPIIIKHNWMFNAALCDFTLEPIKYLEETSSPMIKVRINNYEFWLPEEWHIMVTDHDTYQLDTVTVNNCARIKHHAFAFVADELKLRTLEITVLDFRAEPMAIVHPMINKGMALVHPVGPSAGPSRPVQLSVVIGPHDLYKYLSGKTVGNLLG